MKLMQKTIVEEPKQQFLVKSKLKERGWTDKIIKTLLLEPDEIKENPHYKSGPPMSLYKIERIEEIEASKEFKDLMEKAVPRKITAKKATETKLAKMKKYVDSIKINVPEIPKEKLISNACKHYNQIQMQRANEREDWGNNNHADENSDELFLHRITVNYLRHQLTSYERHLDNIFGNVVVRDAYVEIKEKVLRAIALKYEFLSQECANQIARLFDWR